MIENDIKVFFERIDRLTLDHKPLFGKMNVSQMICHCADQIRMALGSKIPLEYGNVDVKEIMALAKAGKSVPAPKGLGQVEGEGTPPTDFENDKKLLKETVLEFANWKEEEPMADHAYFGPADKTRWTKMVIYHLDHHLKQFGV